MKININAKTTLETKAGKMGDDIIIKIPRSRHKDFPVDTKLIVIVEEGTH